MHRFALISLPFAAFATFAAPSFAADLDGPVYRERDVVIERRAPVVRERVIERRYYSYDVEPTYRAYAPAYDDEPDVYDGYAYVDTYHWRHRPAYFGRPHWWHRHRHWR